MKRKDSAHGRNAEECKELDWVELSEQLDAKDKTEDAIVNETISQIVTEDCLKVDTSDMDGVKAAVNSFYAYDRKQKAKKPQRPAIDPPAEDLEQSIRKSVDEKIIIRSEELKKKRKAPARKGKKEGAAVKTDDSFRHKKGLDKYRKMGVLPTKKNGPSAFRKKSADWRFKDTPKAAVSDEAIEKEISEETFADKIKSMSSAQWGCAIMAAVLLITSVMTTNVYADYRGEINKENAIANMRSFVDDPSMIAYNADEIETEEYEMEDAAAPMESTEGKMLSLVLTSVEKDLKVKLVDEDDTLVKGVRWGINVTDKNGKESTYEDEDEDGIIHLTGMSAGDYTVAIADSDTLSGYVFPTVGQKVSVKAKVEYKVIANIKDEIKKESEVNAAAEDNGNKAADIETGTALTDTVEFVESSVEESGESYEEATVDLSKTEVIASLAGRMLSALRSMTGQIRPFTGNMASIGMARIVAAEETDTEPSSEENKDEDEDDDDDEDETTPTPTPTPTPTEEPSEDEDDDPTPTPKPTTTPTGTVKVTLTPTPTPTPTPEGEYKEGAQLYDSAKNPLYVCDDGSYRLAKYADYGKFSTFYKKIVGYVYTGWQNIDGHTYYYTKDHEKVTGDQVIGGVSYKFNSDGSLDAGSGVLGIDVSKYQPSINWGSVKASGIEFVIIRCGYRGSSTGALIEDPYFKSHIKGAKNAGLKVGVYFFSTALNEAEAVEEASMCSYLCGGYGLNYPVFIDVESSGRPGYNTLSVSQRTANIQAFCKTIASAGYTPGLYANKTWLTEKISTSSLSCKIWLAQYNAAGPTYSGRYDIWQYTSKGSVKGISGNVDMNKSFLRY